MLKELGVQQETLRTKMVVRRPKSKNIILMIASLEHIFRSWVRLHYAIEFVRSAPICDQESYFYKFVNK